MSISGDLISGAIYIPIIVELVVGGALTAAGILILALGRRRWKAGR